ncbi:MAG: MFS transporter [Pseudonocardiaceae bacterium]
MIEQCVVSSTGPRSKPALVLAILCGAPFLAGLDLLVVNVAFAEIGAGFPGHSLADMSWILNGYAIVYAALLISFGRYADKVGYKRVFLGGLGVFTAASAAAALSPTLWALVGFRVLQAAGAAAVTPTSLGLLLHAVAPDRRAASVRIWATSGAVAAALGPLLGGLLVEASWRWVFLINLPVGVALVALTRRTIPGYHNPGAAESLDLPGAALLTLGIGALATGLVRGPEWGWAGAGFLVAGGTAVLALAWFATHNLRRHEPLLAHDLLRVRSLGWSSVASLLFNATFAAGLLILILFLQEVWGYSALRTGLAVAPGPLVVPAFALVGQLLARRVSAGRIAAAGSLLWAAGTAMIVLSVGPERAYAAEVLPGWLVAGFGVGLALPTILSSATAELPPARSATGSAIVNMSRQIGIVLGVAAMVAVFGNPAGPNAVLDAFDRAWWAVASVAVLCAAVATGLSVRVRSAHPA